MSKILSKIFGNTGTAVVDKLAGVADKFIRTKELSAEKKINGDILLPLETIDSFL